VATWQDVRRIALSLPETSEEQRNGGPVWTVRGKMFAWERPLRRADLEALGAGAPTGAILGLRTADLEMKAAMLASDASVFFTTPHFDGYCAVLVHLASVSKKKLRESIEEAWLARAPSRVAKAFLADR